MKRNLSAKDIEVITLSSDDDCEVVEEICKKCNLKVLPAEAEVNTRIKYYPELKLEELRRLVSHDHDYLGSSVGVRNLKGIPKDNNKKIKLGSTASPSGTPGSASVQKASRELKQRKIRDK